MSIDFRSSDPLYVQVASDIGQKVKSGELVADQQLASQKDLAEQYGVSLITIKKALSKLSNDGILYSRMGSGTFVSDSKRSNSIVETGTKKSIELVLSEISNPFFSHVMKGAEKVISEKGFHRC
jgi:GntR family transcriptional regulator of arabinose operon